MQIIKTNINDYHVELEIDPLDDPCTRCWVSRGRYTASLSCLSQTDKLTNGTDHEHSVPDQVIHKIEDWAEANGY